MANWKTIAEEAADVASGTNSAIKNVEKALKLIEDNSEYQAIINVIKDRALYRAKEIDAKVAKGEKVGRLVGVPFIAKDNFLTYGSETTAASNILKGFEAPYQSTAINKLEAEGAICVAKANLDAFAHGGSTENSDFFVTKNPLDKTRVAGGSSGGSAAAVALGLAPFALGSDTGGSIRQPSSFCGVVGLKPTYGLVSRSGVVAMASSTDVIGPITTSVQDAALVLDVMSGTDPLDSTTIVRNNQPYTVYKQPNTPKIGVIKEYMDEGVDPEVKKVIEEAIQRLKNAGAKIEYVSLPSLPLALAVYYIVVPAEVSSNLSRYDGQRFGFSDGTAVNLDDSYELSRSRGFGAEAKRRIMIGTHVLSSGYYDAYYKKAQTVRTKLCQEFTSVFEKVDYLLGPVVPEVAFKIGANSEDPLKMYLVDIMTVASNLVGVPAISVPAGTAQGMPVGIQLIAPQQHDLDLLQLAKWYEETR
ncbi:Asp-tRNA(Asn)/Glu-tRNA(Gln) amidotransferase subunit GatA [bacterium]|nr:Asp-tRNA(Asn)/Glu-tRNA(Gln) amidotransferase subunit GatA [bacterium]NBX98451.1 Asp-tRNA(Asn)/Glu-tRNA(Gln) amidotransferase subunit GatA [bacterium]NDC94107.1 Asp-tRNA(Asn)/Glu-tRNA(Gln) amidotransferase subunit GatA [bacterium]NDD83352.1 Asp-tRNA(Asn)/Glu-tRNA(Gln) amidotransferase subunit GatA [bacterium]NDG28930.1 Asp-tRNA(Asn)/Glu-tRNA(Gln) amidotransferase subunit GatA [bacterium]